MGLTDAQRACIESTDSRLIISAGAGTGKTFTITQKIAHMMETGYLESVDQVLAITFTRKAAGEIKARVRSTLRSRGFAEQALLVDGAWVGTIHGMCSRMLKEHALEIGISPAFEVLDDIDAANMVEESIEEVLASAAEQSDGATYDVLFADYPKAGAVATIVTSLINQAKKSPDGFGSIVVPPRPQAPREIASELLMRLREALALYQGSGCDGKTFVSMLEWTAAAEHGLGALCDEMRADESGKDYYVELCKVLETCGSPKKMRGTKNPEVVECGIATAEAFDRACAELQGYRVHIALGQAIALAEQAGAAYGRKKHERGLMDNDDLLVAAYRALRDVPNMAEHFKNRFRLILVDEFQDTSDLQIAIVGMITGPKAQLCTVGDAQQSIYRFRGADVNVYRRFIAQAGVDPVELGLNFRSHEDILTFSNSIFGLPGVFDDMYLPLEAGRKPEDALDLGGLPRVDVVSVQYGYGEASADDMRRHEAAQVAERFARYREAGVRPGDMVVLMGRMSNSQTYAEALMARGFDVVIAGGSDFWKSAECELVESLLRLVANPLDDEALYCFLGSGVVPIGDDDLVALAAAAPSGGHRVSRGLKKAAGEASPQLALARNLIARVSDEAARRGIAPAVERLLVEAGFVERLEDGGASGAASWANILKAMRFVRQFEQEKGLGASGVAALFAQHRAQESKEGPGILAQGLGNAVRIMTIHASKGLEFPVVALVEFADVFAFSGLRAQSMDGRTYVLLSAAKSSDSGFVKDRADACAKACKAAAEGSDWASMLEGADTYPRYLTAFNGYAGAEDLAEAKRKFYVGVTRASEAIVVGASHYAGKTSPAPGGLLDDLRRAAFGDSAYPGEDCEFDFGGTASGGYAYLRLVRDEDGQVCWEGREDYELPVPPAFEQEAAIPPEAEPRPFAVDVQDALRDERLFSYSSIAPDLPSHPVDSRLLHDEPAGPSGAVESNAASLGALRDDEALSEWLSADEDSATELGLALHAVAEHMALRGMLGGGNASGDREPAGTGVVEHPGEARVEAIASFHGLSDGQRARLSRAVDAWAGSGLARRAAGYRRIRAEVPFCLEFPAPGADAGAEPLLINGEIDLLCSEPGGHEALIVDYKTGGDDAETPEYLLEKHRLQSLCYAYAALTAEFERVEIVFTRVERLDVVGEPQTVSYSYTRADLPAITKTISTHLPL